MLLRAPYDYVYELLLSRDLLACSVLRLYGRGGDRGGPGQRHRQPARATADADQRSDDGRGC